METVSSEETQVNSEETQMGIKLIRNTSEETQVNSEETQVNSELTTQRKEKKRKEKKRKEFFSRKSETDLSLTEKSQLSKKFKQLMPQKKSEKKADPLYKNFMEIYFKWMEEERGVPPIINGREGKSLNLIIAYLRKQSTDDQQILATWTAILHSYNTWDNYHKKNIKISGIETNLPNIINAIKNGKPTLTTGKSITEQRQEIGNID